MWGYERRRGRRGRTPGGSWGRDAIQFLPLVPGFANEQIKGLLPRAGWQEARQGCLGRARPVRAPSRSAGLCRVPVVAVAGQKVLSPYPSPSPHASRQAEASQAPRLFNTWRKAWVGCLAGLIAPLFSHAACWKSPRVSHSPLCVTRVPVQVGPGRRERAQGVKTTSPFLGGSTAAFSECPCSSPHPGLPPLAPELVACCCSGHTWPTRVARSLRHQSDM